MNNSGVGSDHNDLFETNDPFHHNDPFHLARFTKAQEPVYSEVLAELRAGRKRTHWMWYVFPQIAGLAYSETSKYYAIQSLEEARAYLNHPVLGARLRECAEAVLAAKGRSAAAIFGSPDDVKLHSSMTLFAQAAGLDQGDGSEPASVFVRVLEKYFGGEMDGGTFQRLERIVKRTI